MKPAKRIICSLYGAFIIYLVLSLFLGEYGIIEKSRLDEYRDILKLNISKLYNTGKDLGEHSVSLRTDPDMVALLARELGYLRDNEILLHIEGYREKPDQYTVGRTITRAGQPNKREPILRSVSAIAGIFLFLGCTFFRKKSNDKKHFG